MRTLETTLIAVLVWATPALAQDAVATSAVTPEITPIAIGTLVGRVPTSYEDGGRRDPFASLILPKRSTERSQADAARGRPGLGGIALADVVVRGIVRNGPVMLAILEGPNKQSFVARPKDQLLDASVLTIDAAGVAFGELDGAGQVVGQLRKALRSPAEDVR
jgi:hypothetical protein